jgi:hypothetical protein
MNEGILKCAGVVIVRFVILMLIASFIVNPAAAAERPICSVVLESQEKEGDFVVTFAHPFKEGDVKETVVLKAGGEDIGAQVDVKRRYADSSVKHAIISVPIRQAQAGRPLKLGIYPIGEKKPAEPVIRDFPDGFSAEVVFGFPDGSKRRANALEFYQKAVSGVEGFHLVKWLQGPLTSEVQVMGPPCGANGGLDPDLLVIFGLRVFKGGKTVRVELTVESPWVDVPGNVPYDITALIGGKEVMSQKRVGYWHQRARTGIWAISHTHDGGKYIGGAGRVPKHIFVTNYHTWFPHYLFHHMISIWPSPLSNLNAA